MASDKWWRPKWWRRQDHARGRYAPRLWSVWLVAPSAVVAASALAWVIYLRLRVVAVPRPGPALIDPLDVIKTTITIAGFVGAVLVGVYGYRKQRLVEGDAHRADAEQLAQRYTTAADQLGHEKAAVRLAGVYAMARLADDWNDQRQTCINVLCAYMRMPYETDTASEKHREGEREVRHTIISIIGDHLQDPGALTTWCGHYLDFTNATFDSGDFSGAKFVGGRVSFINAKFTGGGISFKGAEFAGGTVYFNGAEFTGSTVSFDGAEFAGGTVYFDGAEFTGGTVYFDDAKFSGGGVFFSGTKFVGGEVFFVDAEFSGGGVFFDDEATFTDGKVSFNSSRFTGSTVHFTDAKFVGGEVIFVRAIFTGSMVYFNGAKFVGGEVSFESAEQTGGGEVYFSSAEFFSTGSSITWGPFKPPAAWTALQEGKR